MDVEKEKARRFQFLDRIYDLSEADRRQRFSMFDVGAELGFDQSLTHKIVQYLQSEDLVQHVLSGGVISISHNGIRQVEAARTKPDEATTHFPALSVINVGNMSNSTIQQSSPHATQTVTVNGELATTIRAFLTDLDAAIDDFDLASQHREDLEVEIATLRAQLKSSKPKSSIISSGLSTIKDLLASATSSAAAAGLLKVAGTILCSL